MNGIDVLARLYRLMNHLAELSSDDAWFIAEVLSRHESGKMLSLSDILWIVHMEVPGEAAPIDPVWQEGSVSALRADLNVTIWRYMPLEALFYLLHKMALHFSSLCVMKDTARASCLDVRTSRQKRSCRSTSSKAWME